MKIAHAAKGDSVKRALPPDEHAQVSTWEQRGRGGVFDFYANQSLPSIPLDMELIPVSQTIGQDRIVEEMVVRFTHSLQMDWLLPGLPPTGRRVEVMMVGIIGFHDGKIAYEHLHWDQTAVLSQVGILADAGESRRTSTG